MVQVAGLGMLILHRRQGADTNYWHTPRLLTITKIILIFLIIILGHHLQIFSKFRWGQWCVDWAGARYKTKSTPHNKKQIGGLQPPTPTLRPSHVLSSSFDHISSIYSILFLGASVRPRPSGVGPPTMRHIAPHLLMAIILPGCQQHNQPPCFGCKSAMMMMGVSPKVP